MRGVALAAALSATILLGGWGALASAAARYDPQDEWQGLPGGEGREEVFYNCVACHSMAIIMQQRMSRPWWERTIERMVHDMGMVEPEPEERERILDYLEEHFGENTPR